ncbi:MAG: phosphoribosyltransferase [Pseudonocardiaceae bacterium]|nr:phosphoribosyltransferase [Pseudonocardiaceae bacterium]
MAEGFTDRRDAGRRLGAALIDQHLAADPVVLGLPRGGVPVAYEVAAALAATLDVLVVRKVGVPGYDELAMGAVAAGDAVVLNDDVVARAGVDEPELQQAIERERCAAAEREERYRRGRPPTPLEGRTAVLVDDGLATGASMRVAVLAARRHTPERVVVAVPVGTAAACTALREDADEVFCLLQPHVLDGVGAWYRDFRPTDDAEVQELLDTVSR